MGADSLADTGKRDTDSWTKIMTPERAWFDINYRELWVYRDLIRLFVWRDFIATYKQALLGPCWLFISPLMTALVFTVVFGQIAQIPTEGAPPFLFYMCGTVCWGYFSGCLMGTSNVFVTNSHLFGKVYFPRLTVPIATVFSTGLKFLIQLGILVGFLLYFVAGGASISAGIWLAAVPFLAVQAGILGMAAGLVISSLTTKYRDLNHFLNFGVQLWMYATPVVYPLSLVPDRYEWVFWLNPMAAVVEGFRKGLLGTGSVTAWHVAVSLGISLLLFVAGVGLFAKTEKTFIDRI